ncbi:hypothetical protein PBY51_014725 [Eleginops maclovinus]|uniref:Uncharacterized protein n=1 Tax=Eleginops maclovinus TaxID=56733 RepID=A0AAN8AFS9_ELEMC|nr:hypothetical protein PBY51_014725 [Eleginops maclovinus]
MASRNPNRENVTSSAAIAPGCLSANGEGWGGDREKTEGWDRNRGEEKRYRDMGFVKVNQNGEHLYGNRENHIWPHLSCRGGDYHPPGTPAHGKAATPANSRRQMLGECGTIDEVLPWKRCGYLATLCDAAMARDRNLGLMNP